MMMIPPRPAVLLALALGACTDARQPARIDRRERCRRGLGEGGCCV
jgi:hypothetical protein